LEKEERNMMRRHSTTLWCLLMVVWGMSPSAGGNAAEPSKASNAGVASNSRGAKWARDWAAMAFEGHKPPFSFTYGGKPSAECLKTWPLKLATRKIDADRVEYTFVYADPNSKLEVRGEGVCYPASDAIEWTVYFTNRGEQDSDLLESIGAIDCVFDVEPIGGSGKGLALHHFLGSQFLCNDFEPRVSLLGRVFRKLVFGPNGGKSSNGCSPYFNLETTLQNTWTMQSPPADGENANASTPGGIVVAVGWPGQWEAEFSTGVDNRTVRIRAGQEHARFKLHAGETARTPLIALLKYEGDWIEGQNAWRHWMFAHNVPKDHGKPIPPLNLPSSSDFFSIMEKATVESQIAFIDGYRNAGIPIDYWWMDAGWYPMTSGRWPSTGTWEVDRKRFPQGLRPVSDHAHAQGVKTILWFEPERVAPGSWLYENRPEWLLKVSSPNQANRLLNLGLPEARRWAVETIDRLMTEEGIDLYRQDFNIFPLPYWQANDGPDREGLTENHYVQGQLGVLDDLRRRRPGLIIDLCASGGMRHDLENLRRGIVFTQSDYYCTLEGGLNQSYALPFLMPYHGQSVPRMDAYGFWCYATPGLHPRWDSRRPDQIGKDVVRRVQVWREVAPCYWGDYYPLTPYSTSTDTWQVSQYHLPSENRGMVQAFRRPSSLDERRTFRLRGLDRQSNYQLTVLDGAGLGAKPRMMRGSELMDGGLDIVIPSGPDVSILSIKAVGD
jgi:alpha-galactosidase